MIGYGGAIRLAKVGPRRRNFSPGRRWLARMGICGGW